MSHQLRHLVALRWRMVRSRQARRGFLWLLAAVPVLLVGAVAAARIAPADRSFDVALVAPTAYLSAFALALAAPLVAGGGNELFPAEQTVAFPVSARTVYRASVLLAPLNLAWATQLVGLVGLAAYIAPGAGVVPPAVLATLAYVVFVTLAGQAIGWAIVGVRQAPGGRVVTWTLAAVVAVAAAVAYVGGWVGALLDRSPTSQVVLAVLDGWSLRWALVTGLLLLGTAAAVRLGGHACAWTLRRPRQMARRADGRLPRRRTPSAPLHALLRTDVAGVWRTTSLRRGLLVMGLLPGLVAGAARLEWDSVVLLPGLVAAGAGLLFGVNVFCLDGTGAVWLSSLPASPRQVLAAKLLVVLGACAAAVTITLVVAVARAPRPPTAGEVAALVACAAVTVSQVVAVCARLSVHRPHRADLLGPRDTPAPPGVMAVYSLRLALVTTLTGVVFAGAAHAPAWQLPAALALPFLLLSARRLTRVFSAWQAPQTRARVAATVASG